MTAVPMLDDVITRDGLRSVFQVIVEVDTLLPVAYEALARGPVGTEWESPAALFAAAYERGGVAELDWACRSSAYRTALEQGLDRRTALFVNVEPSTLGMDPPASFVRSETDAVRRLRVVLEITERAITARPAQVVAAAASARAQGWGVAIDDVGADPASLALLPFVDPDVIKLDLRLIQARPDREVAEIITAVLAHAERTGAKILAEGVETPAHLARARAMGAQYAQGYLFGRPDVAGLDRRSLRGIEFMDRHSLPGSGVTPFEAVSARRATRRSTKAMLVEMSKHLETQAVSLSPPAVVLAAFQDVAHLTPATARRYRHLAGSCPLVAAFGVGLSAEPVDGVRGAPLAAEDPLADEWSVVVVGAHQAAALVARDLGDTGPEGERRFDYAITHDRDLVLEAAATLVRRIPPH